MLDLTLEDFITRNMEANDFNAFDELYKFEHHLMMHVRGGVTPVNDTGLEAVTNEYFLSLLPGKADMMLIRNQCIVLAALSASYAIAAGVETRIAFILYIYYQNELVKTQTPEDVNHLAEVMMEDYSRRCAKVELEPAVPKRVRDAVAYIRKNLHRNLRVEEVAQYSGKSRSQTDKDFRKYLGCTPKEFILREKISESTAYLTYTDQPITEISQLFGFSSPSHYCNTFIAVMGQTPSEYRKYH